MPKITKPEDRKTETVAVRLTRDERAALEALAERDGVRLTDLVRGLVLQHLERGGRRRRRT
jgi:uncharacterized protein (DUF1778 family)